jgi:1-acyl-sn-glycerol-3-phosphate acyltransferase
MGDWVYAFGRELLNQTCRLYYRRIEVEGRERIPATGPAILVANHPNSVADAFVLASQLTPRKINFIAKDTITRAPALGWMVRQFGLVGVARAMEYESRRELARQRNQAAIHTCIPRLLAGELLAIFGEGISTDARYLHVIRKGAMRFGYAAEKATDFRLGLQWIPVGFTYSAKQHFRSDVLIRVGHPFSLADLDPDPGAHEAIILQSGTQRLQRDLEALIVNIEKEELAALIDKLADLVANPASPLAAQVVRRQRTARAVSYFNQTRPERLTHLAEALQRYERQLARAELSDDVVRQRHPLPVVWKNLGGLLRSSLLMVLNLYGWANSFIPRWCAAFARPLARRPLTGGQMDVTKEALFASLAAWLGAAVAFPLQTYFVYLWAEANVGMRVAAGLAAVYALSLIPSWRLFVRRRDILREQFANLRDALVFLLRPRQAVRLQVVRRHLHREVRHLLTDFEAAGPRAA